MVHVCLVGWSKVVIFFLADLIIKSDCTGTLNYWPYPIGFILAWCHLVCKVAILFYCLLECKNISPTYSRFLLFGISLTLQYLVSKSTRYLQCFLFQLYWFFLFKIFYVIPLDLEEHSNLFSQGTFIIILVNLFGFGLIDLKTGYNSFNW